MRDAACSRQRNRLFPGHGGLAGLAGWPGCPKSPWKCWTHLPKQVKIHGLYEAYFWGQLISRTLFVGCVLLAHANDPCASVSLPAARPTSPTHSTEPLPYPAKPHPQFRVLLVGMPSATSIHQDLSLAVSWTPYCSDIDQARETSLDSVVSAFYFACSESFFPFSSTE